jgi:glycine cleavage system transcriptional repressor
LSQPKKVSSVWPNGSKAIPEWRPAGIGVTATPVDSPDGFLHKRNHGRAVRRSAKMYDNDDGAIAVMYNQLKINHRIPMNKMIISVLGQDRPGIIATTTKVLLDMEFNIEDVSQTLLQNQFSGIFIASGPDDITPNDLSRALETNTMGFNLHFHVLDLGSKAVQWATCNCEPFVITTRGPDRKGLVANVTALFAEYNVNVTQLQAAFRGGDDPDKNIMIYEVDIPLDIDQKALRQALQKKGKDLDLQINIQHKSIFEAINRI